MDELKKQQTQEKTALTKLQSKLNRCVQEKNRDDVLQIMEDMKKKFRDFEKVHDSIHDQLEGAAVEASDNYLIDVEKKYSDALAAANAWLSSIEKKEVKKEMPSKSNEEGEKNPIAKEMIAMFNLPRLELDSFDGNPLQYHSFITVFEETVDKVVKEGSTKLTRLLQYTSGAAKAAIQSCAIVGGEKGYMLARRTLFEKFGNDLLISEKIISSLRSGKPMRSAAELQTLSNELVMCDVILTRMARVEEINSQRFIASIVDRLQAFQKNKWRKIAMDMKRDQHKYPDFGDLVNFVKNEAESATDPVYGEGGLLKFSRQQTYTGGSSVRPSSSQVVKPSYQQQNRSQSSAFVSNKSRPVKPCLSCGHEHKLYLCDAFKKLKPEQKLKFIVDNNVCENCLLDNHQVDNCFRPSMCGIGGCTEKHSRFIHSIKVKTNVNVETDVGRASSFTNVTAEVCIPVVQVKVNNSYDSAALLDTCSTTTFCTQRLANSLGLNGISVKYELNTLNSKCEPKETRLIPNLCVESESNGEMFNLKNVYVVDDIPMSKTSIDVSKYNYLNDIPVQQAVDRVDILIGQDNCEALVPLDVRKGDVPGQPFAVKTLLGWSLHGCTNDVDTCGLICMDKVSQKVVKNFITSIANHDSLEEKVERLWKIENEGFGLDDSCKSMSQSDKEVLRFWDENVKVVDSHYELPIPFKADVSVPENYDVASSRLKSLQSSLNRKGIFDKYDHEIQKLLDQGYAECVPESKFQNSKVWYLPHHAVITDKKPDKLRVVFDCAATYQGESLNDKCRQGPDLNNKLIDVLLRFRQHEFAIMGDIEAMYYQVKVSEADRDVLRFLWFDRKGAVTAYRMNAHVFGGVWCASIATYAMRRTLEDQEVEDELVRDIISRAFYVDDCVASLQSIEEVEKVIVDVKAVLQKGGFRLTKFVANEVEVLEKIEEADRAKEVKQFSEEARSRALGVRWDVNSDTFYVAVDIQQKEVVTRKVMLSTIASMYDPLGLISAAIMIGKMLFQDATRLKLDWEECVPEDLAKKWIAWTDSMADLKDVRFPRCMKKSEYDDAEIEVHNFCDASEKGYGCCSYIRCVKEGEISTALIMSKGRIAPIKQVSIPRLELQAAVMASQMNDRICKELDLPITKSYFWTDSQIVLAYIKNADKRFKVYVGNRVSIIISLSDPDQWKFVPGTENPADYISRGVSPEKLMSSMWREGPEFLKEIDVPEQEVDFEVPKEDPEVKKIVANVANVEEEQIHPLDQIMQHFSSWYKVKRIVSWLIKVKERLKEKKPMTSISVEDMRKAEIVLVKHIQSESYSQELKKLKAGSAVNKSSSIKCLLPVLNKDGVICVGGRLRLMKKEETCKHPSIIPHDHPAAEKIVRYYHEKAHQGTEWTLSLLREKYWLTKGRRTIRKVMKKCVTCKKLFGKPCTQQMANLPEERLEANVAPFTYVGVDCFGPYYIKQGRSQVKRYGCIFTCLNVRAVHIEKLNSLETDTFINAFRRFTSRRGPPLKVWSDNGTNLVGASKEIQDSMKKLDEKKLHEFSIQKDFEWNFLPPHASHMGGVYERQIRTIRKVLTSLLNKFSGDFTDEILETLFCEVEAIINSRPLTKVSDDATDLSVLTPNQLLLLNDRPKDFPGHYIKSDVYRQRWKFIQYMANTFWRRWLKEYLPELQKRNKWMDKQVNLEVGDVVLLVEENTPRFLWPLGLVVDVKMGRDNLVRTAKVKTRSTELVRPVSKLVRLEGE